MLWKYIDMRLKLRQISVNVALLYCRKYTEDLNRRIRCILLPCYPPLHLALCWKKGFVVRGQSRGRVPDNFLHGLLKAGWGLRCSAPMPDYQKFGFQTHQLVAADMSKLFSFCKFYLKMRTYLSHKCLI